MYQENIRIGDFEFFRAEIINPQIDSIQSSIQVCRMIFVVKMKGR